MCFSPWCELLAPRDARAPPGLRVPPQASAQVLLQAGKSCVFWAQKLCAVWPKSCVLCGPKGRAWPCCVIPTLYLAGRAEGSGLRLSKQERSWEISKTTAERSFSTQSLIYYCNERCILRQEGGKITGRIPRRRGQTCSQRELGKETLCKLISFD